MHVATRTSDTVFNTHDMIDLNNIIPNKAQEEITGFQHVKTHQSMQHDFQTTQPKQNKWKQQSKEKPMKLLIYDMMG